MAKYDIFISYRRDGGYDTAKHLYDLLTRDGYRVSFDIDTLRNGDFDKSLLKRIDECKDFILVLDSHAFDRTLNPNFNPNNDWLRQELAYALKKEKNIIPIFLNGVQGFPSNLPKDIVGVVKKNGPKYDRYYFNDFYARLKKDFLITKRTTYKRMAVVSVISLLVILCAFFIGGIMARNNKSTTPLSGDVIDGHEYVDLGLSVKWAATNLGAKNNYELGDCYGWGSMEKYSTEEQSKLSCQRMYNTISGQRDRDIVMKDWGVSWRIPTKKECEELLNNCDWVWTNINNTNGYKIVGPNGNWIFLPATGMVGELLEEVSLAGLYGGYWTGNAEDSNTAEELTFGGGGGFIFGDGMKDIGRDERQAGRYIRPVTDN